MFRKINSYRISFIHLIKNGIIFVLCLIYGLYFQNAYNLYPELYYKKFRAFFSFLGLGILIFQFLSILFVFFPLIRYLFKYSKLYTGEIVDVRSFSRGLLNWTYYFEIKIKCEDKTYDVYRIKAIFGNDFEINYGDCELLLKGKKVKFYISLLNKDKALIKKIIE